MAVEFSVLGEVEARIDGRAVDLGHAQQRWVLAALLVEANRPVPVDRLAELVWGDHPPRGARGTLRSYLCRLRQALAATDEVAIVRQPGGYALTVDPLAVDVFRFQHLVAEARAVDDDNAAELYATALGLWRGTPLATVDTPELNAVRAGWDRERHAAELDRNDVALRRGGHAALLGELAAAGAVHPLDERLAGQLLLALYRCGRQADALDRYQQLRRRLAEELGTDPSPPLRLLHQQILTADPALAAPPRLANRAPPSRTGVPRQLPAPPPAFRGRLRELAQLDTVLEAADDPPSSVLVAAICGTGGIGKTWLALRWAHDNLARFGDGQLYVNLRGFDPAGEPVPPAVAVRGFLDALGVDPAAIPVDLDAQAALYRSLVAGKRLLIVADNAQDSGQVLPLLPGTPTCTVLVTSRRQLPRLVTAHGARPLTLDVLTSDEGRQLLADQLGPDRVADEPEPVGALLRQCAGLPLALGIAAARAALRPDLPLAALAEELREASTRLDGLDAGELAVNLRAVLSCSVRVLPTEAAGLFALLGLAPGADIGLPAVASLSALPTARVRLLLRELAGAHLVQEARPGRYRMHDLVRLYAAEQARARFDEKDRRAATHRLLDHYLHTAYAADRMLQPHREPITPAARLAGVAPEAIGDHGAALAWFTTEHPVLLAAIGQAVGANLDVHAWQLAWSLVTFFDRRGHWHDRAATQRTALHSAQRLADRHAQAQSHRGVALANIWLGRYDDARTELGHALDLFGRLGNRIGQADTYRSLARASARQGCHGEALPYDLRALDLYRAAGHRPGQATALNAVGWHHAHLGNYGEALANCEQARALHEELGDRHGQAATLDSLGYTHHHLGQYAPAVSCYQSALDLFREVGDRYQEAETLTNLGDTYRAAGDSALARRCWRYGLEILTELGHSDARAVAARLLDREGRIRTAAPLAS